MILGNEITVHILTRHCLFLCLVLWMCNKDSQIQFWIHDYSFKAYFGFDITLNRRFRNKCDIVEEPNSSP